jgi:hypothetical protein
LPRQRLSGLSVASATLRPAFLGFHRPAFATTRRLCGIAEGYAIFGDIEKTMELSLSRFPAAVRESWLDTYKKLVEVTANSNGTATAAVSKDPTTAPWMNT